MKQFTRRSEPVTAIQFLGTWDSLADITGFIGENYIDGMQLEEDKKTVPYFNISSSDITVKVEPTQWVAKDHEGLVNVLSDVEMQMLYQEVTE